MTMPRPPCSPEALEGLASREHVDPATLARLVGEGHVAIMGRAPGRQVAIGKQLATKVNVNLGTSPVSPDEAVELEKARVAVATGADTVSDCSMGGNLDGLRRHLVRDAGVPVTTIPVYQVAVESKTLDSVTGEAILDVVKRHVDDGVASIVIHAGFDRAALEAVRTGRRVMGIVSKGGSITAAIALSRGTENPFVMLFDDILDLLEGTGVVLNLGNAMRSGCIHDLKDEAQHAETLANARLARRANERGVQAIIEGLGGHVNAGDLPGLVREHDAITGNRPLFVAGPLPTEIGLGHDHVSAAIGGAIAAGAGADYLCAITPAEHLSLPTVEQVREGTIAARIAAHVGDSIKRGLAPSCDRDRELSMARARRDWQGQFACALDPETARATRGDATTCTMCGKYCAIALMAKYLGREPR